MSTWYYTWAKHIVKDPKLIPNKPHYVVLTFEQNSYSSAGYDPGDSPYTSYYTQVDYYAFTDRELWEKMISDIHTEKQPSYKEKNFVFFESGGSLSVDVKVSVKVK